MDDDSWRDPKRYLWLLGLVVPLLPFIAFVLHRAGAPEVVTWIGPMVVLGLVPLADLAIGIDPSNPPEEVVERLEADRYYRWVTYAFLPLQYAGLVLALVWLTQPGWLDARPLGFGGALGLAVTLGFVGGIAINTAHELGHKREQHERWLSKVALAQSGYGHFYIEHNRGHHVRVATPDDPASARFGESLWAYLPRTVVGSLRSAWRLERRRLTRGGGSPWRAGNDVLNAWLMTLLLWGALTLWLGPGVLAPLLLAAVVSIWLLESVNYLEHYGLLRQRVGAPGRERYERVDARHSWNSNHLATNVLLYHLQRHSDHHARPTRRYQVLRDRPEAPVLPTGYAGMILLAMVPPLWRRVMDARVLDHVDGDLDAINLAPGRRVPAGRASTTPPREPAPTASTVPGTSTLVAGAATVRSATCPGCGYVYHVARGEPREGFPPGTAWSAIPDGWCCPDCGVREKLDFVSSG